MEPNKNTSVFLRDRKSILLGDVCSIKTGKRNNQDKDDNGLYPFFVRSSVVEKINTYSFDGEAILMPGEGNIGDIIHYINGKFDFHQRVYKISNFDNDLCGKYVFYALQKSFKKWALKNTVKATVDSLRLPTFQSFSFYAPKKEYQEKIVQMLDAVVNHISNIEKLIAKQESLKKTTVKLLLTSKPHWTEYKIKEKFKVTRGLVLSTNQMSKSQNGVFQYPVYSSQTQNNGLIGFYNNFLYQDAITWTTDGANAGFVRFRPGKFYCTNVCGVLLSDEGYANTCVATMLGNVSKKYVSYVGNPKLMNNVMAEIPLLFPSVQEQQYISDKIQKLDQQLEHLRSELDKYRNIKKGLMDYFFG